VPDSSSDPPPTETRRGRLSLWDVVSLILGIVVGTSIFRAPASVFANVPGPLVAAGAWVLGAVITFAGALCYAELAAAWPRSGGDYEYLNRAFGRWMGFQFAWGQLVAVFTGSIGAMAYAFADYAVGFWGLGDAARVGLACGSIIFMTLLNLLGLTVGKTAQNLLTIAKVLGLTGVIVAGFAWGDLSRFVRQPATPGTAGFGLAMVFVLYSYGGWSHAAYVASEVNDPRRNIPRALLAGIALITLVYLAMNAAYLAVLGYDDARTVAAPALETMRRAVGEWGGKGVGLLVMTSALGAINGMILTGARVFAALGRDHRLLSWLGDWSPTRATPLVALVTQCAISLALVVGVGTAWGQQAIDALLTQFDRSPVPWSNYGGFETLVVATAPLFWGFFLLTGLSVFILRWREPHQPRPFRLPLYPLEPILFCASSAYMLWSSTSYAGSLAWFNLLPIVTGGVLYVVSRRLPAESPATPNGD
jgi:APA family basic amino acid/polyamine antiporter